MSQKELRGGTLMQFFMLALAIVYISYMLVLKFKFHDDSLFAYIYIILATFCLIAGIALFAGLPAVGWIFTGISCAFLLIGIAALIVVSRKSPHMKIVEPVQWIAVLGCALNGQKPGRLLAGRLNVAIGLHAQYPDAPLVVCGGRGPDEEISEAEAMALYLEERGVRPEHIIKEDVSTTTKEGLKYYLRICGDPHANVIIVTSDFHALRTAQAARECQLTSCAVATFKTPAILWVNLSLRDACAAFTSKVFPDFHNTWIGGKRL